MVHILNSHAGMLAANALATAWIGAGEGTVWGTDAGVWKRENKSQKLLSPARSVGGNRMPESPHHMPPPQVFWVSGFIGAMGELGWRGWQLIEKWDGNCLAGDKAAFVMIKLKLPDGDRERRYQLREEGHLEGWESALPVEHTQPIQAPLPLPPWSSPGSHSSG